MLILSVSVLHSKYCDMKWRMHKKNPSYIVSKIFKHHNKFSGTFKVKAGLAQMAKGGIIMDVTTSQEARIAEEAGVMSRDHEYIVYHISIF